MGLATAKKLKHTKDLVDFENLRGLISIYLNTTFLVTAR
jgi:hypothetical protein